MVSILIIVTILSIVPEAVRSGEGICDMEGYITHEEWRVNPQDYIDCSEVSRGKAVYRSANDEFYWQLYLVDQNDVWIISQLTDEVINYHHGFDCDEIRFSPNAEYCLLVNRLSEECAIIDLSSGTMDIFKPYEAEYQYGSRPMMARISDSGSMLFLSDKELIIYDSDHNLIARNDDQFPINPSVGFSHDGDFFCITNGNQIDAYNEDGPAWSVSARIFPSHNLWGRVYVAPDGLMTLACVNNKSQIQLLENPTGSTLKTIYLDGALYGDIRFSPNSEYAVYSTIDPTMESDKIPSTCAILSSADGKLVQFNSLLYCYSRLWGAWIHKPLAVADNGNSLWLFTNRPGFYRLILYSSAFQCISASNWITSHSSIPEFVFNSSVSREGNGYCTFDGIELVFYSLCRSEQGPDPRPRT